MEMEGSFMSHLSAEKNRRCDLTHITSRKGLAVKYGRPLFAFDAHGSKQKHSQRTNKTVPAYTGRDDKVLESRRFLLFGVVIEQIK
jgi:hypothetical protein